MAEIDQYGWQINQSDQAAHDDYILMINEIMAHDTNFCDPIFIGKKSNAIRIWSQSVRKALTSKSVYWDIYWPEKERLYSFLMGACQELWIRTGLDLFEFEWLQDKEVYCLTFVFRNKNIVKGKYRAGYDLKELIETPMGELITGLYTWMIENLTVLADQMMEQGNPEGKRIASELAKVEERTQRHETHRTTEDK